MEEFIAWMKVDGGAVVVWASGVSHCAHGKIIANC